MKRLFLSGFVVRIGGGRKYQYELRRSDNLVKAIVKLFQSESERFEALLLALKNQIEQLSPYASAAWIQYFPHDLTDLMVLGVLHETRHLAQYVQLLQKQLQKVERNFDLTIEVKGYTKADLPFLETRIDTPLYGIMPFSDKHTGTGEMEPHALTHVQKDQQLLDLSRKLAEAIDSDSSLVRRAKEHVQRLLGNDRGSATKDLEEWRDILESYSIRRLSQLLTSASQRAVRLRQSNPFLAILNREEIKRFLKRSGGNE
jgi:hypothetical protein